MSQFFANIIKLSKYIETLFYICLSILIAFMDKAPLDLDIRFKNTAIENAFYIMYDGIIHNTIDAPYPYRFLIPYSIKILSQFFQCSPINIAFFINVIFIFITLKLFTNYANHILSPFIAFLTTFIIAFYIIIIQSHFIGITIVESQDMANIIFFIILLLLAKEENWLLIGLVMALSVMNRETPLVLLAPFSYYLIKNKKITFVIYINLTGLLMYICIRTFLQVSQGNYPDFTNLRTNFPGLDMNYLTRAIKNNIILFCMIGPLIIFAFYNFKRQTLYNKLLILTSIPFCIIHFIMGSILEIRLFFPLVVLVLPFSIKNLQSIFEQQNQTIET